MKPELYFELPDDQGVMLEVIRSIPKSWLRVSGELYASGHPCSARYKLDDANFVEYRGSILACVRRGLRGGIEVRHSAYNGRLCQSSARVTIQLARWIGWQAPEIGWQPARVRLSWHEFTKNSSTGSEYLPVIDEQYSGTYAYVASVANVCRHLGLREYEVIRACDYHRDWQAKPLLGTQLPLAEAAE